MKKIMVCLALLGLILPVSAVVYQNIAVETEGFEICYNDIINCSDSINKTSKSDGVIYLKHSDFNLLDDPSAKFMILIEDIFFPILIFLILGGMIYAFFYMPYRSIFT